MQLSDRLREERERLGLNQTDFAAAANVTRKTVFNWESGAAVPSATALELLSQHGLDVMYVITGRRETSSLTAEEASLVDNYRHATPAGKKAAREVLFALTQSTPEFGPQKAANGGE